ncbi:MAG: SDR family NAD(P)-dependent oxidoreductase [Burkholderiales bacterium]
MNLTDRVALVTGAAGGLGAVISRALASEGAHVAVTYRGHKDEGAEVCREIETKGRKALLLYLDQNDPASCEAAVNATVTSLGRLDILVNNAGVSRRIPFQDLDALTPEIWDLLMDTNLRGPFLMTRAAASHLKRQDNGRVVNVSGFPGLTPEGSSIGQAVSKAGLIHLTKCLAVALAPKVAVNCVAPGLMEGTRMSSTRAPEAIAAFRERALLKRSTSLEDVARQVLLYCQADSITGQTQAIDGGIVFH